MHEPTKWVRRAERSCIRVTVVQRGNPSLQRWEEAHSTDCTTAVDGRADSPAVLYRPFLSRPRRRGGSLPFAKYLLTDYGVVLVPGNDFGAAGEGRLRLSFADSMDRSVEGLDRIAAGIAAY